MEFETLKAVLRCGDRYGSAIREMMRDLGVDDLTKITQEQAEQWLAYRKGIDDNDNKNN